VAFAVCLFFSGLQEETSSIPSGPAACSVTLASALLRVWFLQAASSQAQRRKLLGGISTSESLGQRARDLQLSGKAQEGGSLTDPKVRTAPRSLAHLEDGICMRI
jgi:hypothetical protein